MDFKKHTLGELSELVRKGVVLEASPAMSRRCGMVLHGMAVEIVDVIENTNEVMIVPINKQFRSAQNARLISIRYNGWEWGISRVLSDDWKEEK